MEIYSFYQTATMTAMLFTDKQEVLFIAGLIGGAAILLVLFLLQGFGLYKMAKNRGIKNRALAFVPFVNLWFVGKLAGECHFFGQKVKRAGMYAMIAQIVGTVFCVLTIAAELYLWLGHGAPQINEQGMAYWVNLTGFAKTVSTFYALSAYLLSIFQLVYEIFLVVLFMGLYKQYTPKNYMGLGLLTLFVPLSRFIIVFVLRNRKRVDFEAYIRARNEAYARQYGQYRNPYANPYQNTYQPPKPEDPFEEFSAPKNEDDKDEFFS